MSLFVILCVYLHMKKLKRNLKEQILELRKTIKSHREIAKIVGCSITNVDYHCNEKCKAKSSAYTKKRRERLKNSNVKRGGLNRLLHIKVSSFRNRRVKGVMTKLEGDINTEQVLNKFGIETSCYITGTPINILTDSYHFDHIIPVSKGGDCSIDNLGIASVQANRAKHDLTLEELHKLCKTILQHAGYEIIKR